MLQGAPCSVLLHVAEEDGFTLLLQSEVRSVYVRLLMVIARIAFDALLQSGTRSSLASLSMTFEALLQSNARSELTRLSMMMARIVFEVAAAERCSQRAYTIFDDDGSNRI